MKRILLVILVASVVLIGAACSEENKDEEAEAGERYVYTQYEWEDLSSKQFLGSPDAEHTLLLAFDYACSWCKKWMAEVLPELQTKLIDTGNLKYYSQAVALLSQESLELAQVDNAIETLYPEHYFELQDTLSSEAGTEGWGSDEYITDKLSAIGLSVDILEDERLDTMTDRLRLTREYTRNLDMQSVPSVYVDGIKLYDPFSLEEIMGIIEGTIKAGDYKIIN